MLTRLTHVTRFVHDLDEARDFYTDALDMVVRDDAEFGEGFRWLTVAPPDQDDVRIVLQEPNATLHGEDRAATLREQVGHAPTMVFEVDDCEDTVTTLRERDVTILSDPEAVEWGVSAMVADCYGNPINLVEPAMEA
jgi:catechol 2,3-dioxygenase-like lactoylglutathione lyase family enzyme